MDLKETRKNTWFGLFDIKFAWHSLLAHNLSISFWVECYLTWTWYQSINFQEVLGSTYPNPTPKKKEEEKKKNPPTQHTTHRKMKRIKQFFLLFLLSHV